MTRPVDVTTERPELGRVLVRGATLSAEVQELITGAGLSWSTTEITQMSLTVEDPGFQLWHSGLFAKDTLVSYRPTGFAEELRLRIAAFDVGGGATGTGGFTVKARSDVAWRFKRRRGPVVMPNTSATEFLYMEVMAENFAQPSAPIRLLAQPTIKRAQVARDVPEPGAADKGAEAPSDWTTFARLAEEEGFLLYEFAGCIYFGSPKWLMANLGTEMHVGWQTPNVDWNAMKCPSIAWSDDAEKPVTLSGIEVRPHRVKEAAPGRRLMFHGIHPFIGAYLITSMSLPMMGTGNLVLSAERDDNPPPLPPSGQVGQTIDTARSAQAVAGGATAQLFVSQALSQSGKRFAYGAQAWATDNNPSAFESSELIQWAAARCGVVMPEGSILQIMNTTPMSVAEGLRTRGALLFRLPGRIAISLGDGRIVEARIPEPQPAPVDVSRISWAERDRLLRAGWRGRPGDRAERLYPPPPGGPAGVGIYNASDVVWTNAGRIKGLQY